MQEESYILKKKIKNIDILKKQQDLLHEIDLLGEVIGLKNKLIDNAYKKLII